MEPKLAELSKMLETMASKIEELATKHDKERRVARAALRAACVELGYDESLEKRTLVSGLLNRVDFSIELFELLN